MPNLYFCSSCRLSFQTGWFHYHQFDSGYAAATFLVCKECGTQHQMEHAIRDQLPERMFAQPEPVTNPDDDDPDRTDSLLDSILRFGSGYKEWQSYQVQSNPRPEREEHKGMPVWFEGITDKLHLADVKCSYCGSATSLVSECPEENSSCPRCKEPSLKCVAMWTA